MRTMHLNLRGTCSARSSYKSHMVIAGYKKILADVQCGNSVDWPNTALWSHPLTPCVQLTRGHYSLKNTVCHATGWHFTAASEICFGGTLFTSILCQRDSPRYDTGLLLRMSMADRTKPSFLLPHKQFRLVVQIVISLKYVTGPKVELPSIGFVFKRWKEFQTNLSVTFHT